MRKILAAVGLAALAVGALSACDTPADAVPATPTLSSNDTTYVTVVQQNVPEVKGYPALSLVKLGHAVCSDFDHGNSLLQEVTSLMYVKNNPLSPHSAGFVVGSSIQVYCPKYTYLIQDTDGSQNG